MIVEVQFDPQQACSDGLQIISTRKFEALMRGLWAAARAVGQEMP